MTAGGWKAISLCASFALVIALLACLRSGSSVAAWLTVLPLMALSGYADYRADKARNERGS